MQHITIAPIEDFGALGRRWAALEAESDGGFFRSWAFLGCLAEERFAGARLLSVTENGADLALALLGGRRGQSWLNQTGDAVADSLFIERNGLLARRGRHDVVAPALRHAAHACGRLVLAGVDEPTLAAARDAGWLALRQTRLAPCVNLAESGGDILAALSANTRAQIRRSMRLYGPGLRLERADNLPAAHDFLAEMVQLHQASWQARGRPGAFAAPAVRRFHTALVDRAYPAGAIDLLRVSAGGRHVGTLYTFLQDGRAMSYQSGFSYGADGREKPGLVCHVLAIGHYAARGFCIYDFLAGGDRYKTSLAPEREALHWAVLYRPGSVSGLLAKIKDVLF